MLKIGQNYFIEHRPGLSDAQAEIWKNNCAVSRQALRQFTPYACERVHVIAITYPLPTCRAPISIIGYCFAIPVLWGRNDLE